MGLSIRAYARHRGVSDAAVRKAIAAGRITPNADGTLDPAQADAQWSSNTEAPRVGSRTPAARAPVPADIAASADVGTALPTGGASLLQARTVNEVLKAKIKKLELEKRTQQSVDRARAIAHVFHLARVERDAWLNWPARVSAQLASQLGTDGHALHVALEAAVRAHLLELGEIRPKVD